MDTERQIHDISLRQLEALLEAQTRLRKAAEGMALEARRQMERLAVALCPQQVDEVRRRSPEGLDALSLSQIADMVLGAVHPAHRLPPLDDLRRRCAKAEERAEGLAERLRAAEARAAEAAAEAVLLRQRLHQAEQALAANGDPLLARHGPARGPQVRAAAALLSAAGYSVDTLPGPLTTPDGDAFLPDLMLQGPKGLLPVEVEDLSRPPQERESRWAAICRVSAGHLCLVAPNPRQREALCSEVLFWAGTRPLSLWVTDLQQGQGRSGEAVWLVHRERR